VIIKSNVPDPVTDIVTFGLPTARALLPFPTPGGPENMTNVDDEFEMVGKDDPPDPSKLVNAAPADPGTNCRVISLQSTPVFWLVRFLELPPSDSLTVRVCVGFRPPTP
jgi:hypothetical protein